MNSNSSNFKTSMAKSEKAPSPVDIIRRYLDDLAAKDPQFAVSYAKENKSLKECWSFIMGEARKRAVGSSCCMTDQEVFGLAVHYYDEDDIEITPVAGGVKVKAQPKPDKPGASPKPKKKPSEPKCKRTGKDKKPNKQPVQLELFNWDEL